MSARALRAKFQRLTPGYDQHLAVLPSPPSSSSQSARFSSSPPSLRFRVRGGRLSMAEWSAVIAELILVRSSGDVLGEVGRKCLLW